jgi:hypothetical protein
MLDVGNGKTTGTATPAEYKQGIAKNAPTPETAYGTQFKDYVWASLKATICSDASSAATIPGEATTWDLTYADGAVVEATAAGYPEFPQPEFPQAGQLAPGHCITGTITYAVPAATRPAHVQYGMALDKPLEWNIPQQ